MKKVPDKSTIITAYIHFKMACHMYKCCFVATSQTKHDVFVTDIHTCKTSVNLNEIKCFK